MTAAEQLRKGVEQLLREIGFQQRGNTPASSRRKRLGGVGTAA